MQNTLEIVCVSFNGPPMNDAEALCTGRMLSGLVEYGADVHLITLDSDKTLPTDIVEEIFNERIKITRVPLQCKWSKMKSILKYGIADPNCGWIKEATEATIKILEGYENPPILITRSMPIISNIVGYYCSDFAKIWIPHFSDPFPPDEWRDHWYSHFAKPFNRSWARRILKKADLITVTCRNAIRYIEEKSRYKFSDKAWVLTHLAIPKLKSGNFKFKKNPEEYVVAYIGNLMNRRRPELILNGVLLAMEKHPQIKFLQLGNVDPEILEMCRENHFFSKLDIRHINNLNPRDASDLQRQVDVNVIVDTDLGLPYSPFILSKFSHSVCAGKPLLMISSNDCAMWEYTKKYGGGEFVPFSSAEDVCYAIVKLYENRTVRSQISEKYMHEFSCETIIKPFIEEIFRLLEKPNVIHHNTRMKNPILNVASEEVKITQNHKTRCDNFKGTL